MPKPKRRWFGRQEVYALLLGGFLVTGYVHIEHKEDARIELTNDLIGKIAKGAAEKEKYRAAYLQDSLKLPVTVETNASGQITNAFVIYKYEGNWPIAPFNQRTN